MLYLNISRVMKLRGMAARSSSLLRAGFNRATADKYVRNQVSKINLVNLEKLCLMLDCTPNDLFEWQPDSQTAENTVLKALVRDNAAQEITQIVKDMPLDKLDKVRDLLKQLKEE